MTNAGKVIDLLVNKEAFWVSNEEKLDARNPPWLENSVMVDVLVVKDRSRLGMREPPTDMLFDWLDTLGLNNMDSADDGKNLWRRLDLMVWDAERWKNRKIIIYFQQNAWILCISWLTLCLYCESQNKYFDFSKTVWLLVISFDTHTCAICKILKLLRCFERITRWIVHWCSKAVRNNLDRCIGGHL